MTSLAKNVGLVALAVLVAFAITAIGQGVWGVIAIANVKLTPAIPWAVVLMPVILALMVAFLAGRLGPKWGADARRTMLPLGQVSARDWGWSLAAGGAGVIAAAGLWTVLASLVRMPPNLLPDMTGVPLWTAIPMLLVAIAAAPLTEEIAFRGYAMGLLRRRFGPLSALVITSVIFAAAHLTQGLYAPKLLVYFLAGLLFGAVALRTGSLLPAMVVHSLGDLTFFTLVWSHDAGRKLVTEGGADGWFYGSLALVAVFTPLCLLAFRQLGRVTNASVAPALQCAPAAA